MSTTSPCISNPNHHIWNNHGTWWVHATVIRGGLTQERVRRSLATTDPAEARTRRDQFLSDLALQPGLELSLRFGRVPRDKSGLPTSGTTSVGGVRR